MNRSFLLKAVSISLCALAVNAGAADAPNGKAIYDEDCAVCHLKGSPRTGDVNAWAPLLKGGLNQLYANTIKGKGTMDARGGNDSLTDVQVQAAVNYMVAQSGGAALVKGYVPSASASASSATVAKPATPAMASPVAGTAMTGANAFNRLMREAPKYNLPPAQDGIHNPAAQGTLQLQPPLEAFATLPKSSMGNRVDWTKALNDRQISPLADRRDPNIKQRAMDTQIVREVKGSMPDVVFPHKTHTQWLACGNCHPAIFAPEVNPRVNAMSMAAISLGQSCGVCHGTVAFPVSECRRCHAKNKAG